MTEHLDKDTRREQILDAAAKMFIARGYEDSSVDDIARLAGLSKGSIYWYFKSKLEILFELSDRCVEQSQEEILHMAFEKYGNEVLFRAFKELHAIDLRYPDREMLFHQLHALAARYPEIRERLKLYHRQWDATGERVIQKVVADSGIQNVDAMVLAQAITSLWNGLHIRKEIDPDIDVVLVVETATKLMYDALVARRQEEAPVEEEKV
jgi:AcrR family transcriptional regulator